MPMSILQPSSAVSNILNRAATDPAFRNLLYTDPGAALAGANLTDTDLAGANLAVAILDGAIMTGVRYSDTTRWPHGFTLP